MRPAVRPDLYASRTARLKRLIELDAPAGIVARECWLVIRAYGGGRGYGWLVRKWWWDLRGGVAYEVMAVRHRIGWHEADCCACEAAKDVAEDGYETLEDPTRADSGSLSYTEPYPPEMSLRGFDHFRHDIEPGLSDTIGARLTRYEREQRRDRSPQ